jgi:pimeloyl-ACP methyl ester carboxylesterase
MVGCLILAGALAGCGAENDRKQDHSQTYSAEAARMHTVTSRDGTKIAYDKQGSGPPVILVNGALAGREAGSDIAKRLAGRFTVYSYDRRGRGDSGDTQPFDVEREIEDIAALIEAAGGTVYLAGFSSGAALALEAASALGPKVDKLALYEAPYDESAGAADKWRTYRAEQAGLLDAGRRGEAVLHHMKFVGIPDAAVAEMKTTPAWAGMEAMAPTLPYDVAAIGDDRSVPVERAAKVRAKVLVMDGGASRETMPFMRASADTIAQAVPNARRLTLDGQGHNARPDAIAPVLIAFFSEP